MFCYFNPCCAEDVILQRANKLGNTSLCQRLESVSVPKGV